MDLPSARELELETALRQRNAQVSDLTVNFASILPGSPNIVSQDEVTRLRQYISANPPAPTDTATLPPSLMAVLLPHIQGVAASSGTGAGGTVASALTQRVKTLQEENDELYNLLKKSETGRLKEEVHSLTRVVTKLDGALRESHKVIQSLSNELEKTHETFARNNNLNRDPNPKHSPRNNYAARQSPSLPTTSTGKAPPTGPRSHKKPRMSDTQPKRDRDESRGRNHTHNHSHHRSHSHSRKMDVDRDDRGKGERERERDKERERDDRDGNRSRKSSASNGFPHNRAGGGGRRNGGVPMATTMASGDRTLAERMGLDGSLPSTRF
ncbi:hypothetical protein BDZ89DRAFT_1164764 [Hymenopellis radicata]|nr:hypothetical protein BDZ89DRAFT_1164764 [Hymenopellis radicata]